MPAPLASAAHLDFATTAAPHQTGIQPWQLVVAISVVLGIIVGFGSFIDWGSRIRNRRVDKRVLELVRDQLTAEDVEGRLKELVQLNRSLREQIEGLPAEANRLFLQQRMDALATSIAHDFEEYRSLELAIGTSASSTALDPMIRQAIERNMVSPQKRRDRRNIYVLVLLGLLVALNFIPISVSGLVYQYFGTLGDSPYSAGEAVITAMIIGSTVIAVLLLFLAELIPKLMPVFDRLGRPLWLAVLSMAIVVAAAVGYWFRYLVITQPCFQLGCGSSPGTYAVIGVALFLVPLLAGLLFATLVRRAWLWADRQWPTATDRTSVGRRHQTNFDYPPAARGARQRCGQ